MKRNNIIKGIAAFAALALLPACSSDYLDLRPEANPSEQEALGTVESAQFAVNGICLSMNTQYQSTNWNQYNGEAYVNTICNDAMGQDYISGLAGAWWGNETLKAENWNDPQSSINVIPWDYCYGLIQQANKILDNYEGNIKGSEEGRAWIKAQALTFRAFAYTKLLQFYAPRWQNSNNGETYCLVMRTSGKTENCPLGTMNDVLKLVYSDLDEALSLYDQASGFSRDAKWGVDKSIAQGVYARAALVKNDWAKAKEMAHNARQGYQIMDADTYMSGFYTDNNDLMWGSSNLDEEIYYWSFGSHYAANGQYTKNWQLGAGAIDIDLYNQLDPNDIRRKLYLMPDKVKVLTDYNRGWNPGKIVDEDWWNGNLVGTSNNMDLSTGPFLRANAGEDGKWGLYNIALRYSWYYAYELYKGDINDCITPEGFVAYFTLGDNGDMQLTRTEFGSLTVIPFGAQYKFFSKAPYGTGIYPYMRASEMCLAEAEAAYHLGDVATAQNCLKEINSKRITGYNCTLTGEDLFTEIVKTRRIELWGEGQNWSDFKRWNLPIVRRAWVEGDVTSGNWMAERACTIDLDANNGWMLTVPQSESDYNPAVDRNLLPQPTN